MLEKPLFKEALWLLIIIFVINKIGLFYGLYLPRSPIPEFDLLPHFLAGICLTLGFLWFYFYSGFFEPANRRRRNFIMISVLAVIFIGVSWEIFELITGVVSVSGLDYYHDTTLDLVFDFLGGVAACIYAINIEKKRTADVH
jgi:hypothetical protein